MKISVITPTIRPIGLESTRNSLLKQTFRDFEWLTDINWTGGVDLNQSLNRLIRRAKGELIVFVQDYVEMPPDSLQRFWEVYQSKPAFYTVPVSKYDYENETWDWRAKRNGTIDWREWEIDCGSAPREALVKIGGFDEELDRYWGYDNPNVALRAHMKGYEFFCLPDIKCRAYDHNKHEEHPFRDKQNADFANTRLAMIESGALDVNYMV
jgi:GT2 family glycosyltransferase